MLNRHFFSLFLLFVFLALPLTTSAAISSSGSVFSLEGVGTTSLPTGCSATAAVGTESMTNMETQYDLSATDTAGIHYARLLVYKAPQDLGMAGTLIDLIGFKPEIYPLLSEMGKTLVSKKLEENNLKLIEWLPANKSSIPNHPGIQLALRATLPEKLPLPMFAIVNLVPRNGQITAVVLICPDIDKNYWQPIYLQMLGSLKENS
ncbi:hypothetical protein [Azotosporobacter soli]|uniref:hypothetical protein n=1 Tax=Azotosporobacter soli TaxID=3055040 RepID=UPI0031FEA451